MEVLWGYMGASGTGTGLPGYRKVLAAEFRRLSHRFVGLVRSVSRLVGVLTVVGALMVLTSIVIYVGFDHRPKDVAVLMRLIRCGWVVFMVNVLLRLFYDRGLRGWRGVLVRGMDLLLLLTALPLLVHQSSIEGWWPDGLALLYSRRFIFAVLGAYSVMEVSYAVSRIPGRRTSPVLLLSSSFLVLITVGALLLLLPKSTTGGISLIDAFFVSTSAVCITGLTPVDVSVTFTPMGLIVLSILIELGGLGVLTFTSFFALFFSGNASIYSQLVMRDVIFSKSMSGLFPTMLYILCFTLAIQIAGAVGIYFTTPAQLGLSEGERMMFAMFTSLSAFCNAGFSNLPDGFANPVLLHSSGQGIYWVTSAIVIAGAVGFPLLVNIKDALMQSIRRGRVRRVHLFDTNTKIVAVTFFWLFALSAAAFFLLEYDNTLAGMTFWQKISQAVFNATTPRSSGFVSVNPANFLPVTLVMVMALMWVGGAAQSTAGGVKVNTLAAVLLNLRAIVTGRPQATAFRRTIARASISRANAVVAISIFAAFAYVTVMLLLEPDLPTRSVLFESLSALFTVGSSLGITDQLGIASKTILCTAMFLGRVGIISLLIGMAGRAEKGPVSYPTDNIIIN